MNSTVEKRRATLINVAYFALLIGAFYLFMHYAFWTLSPFIFAFFIAMLLQKPIRIIEKRTPFKKSFLAFAAVLILASAFAGIVTLIGTSIINEIKDFIDKITNTFTSVHDFISKARVWVADFIEPLPDSIEGSVSDLANGILDKLLTAYNSQDITVITPGRSNDGATSDITAWLAPLSGVISTASKLPGILIGIVVFFIATFFITADYDRIVLFMKRQLPEGRRDALSKAKALTLSTLGKMAKAYFLIICITFTEILIGLSALDLFGVFSGRYKVVISLCIAIVDIFPVLGSGTVLIPWGIISLLTGNYGLGAGLLIMYVIITVLRQYIEPKLVAGQLGLPPAAALVAMYLGLKIFGVFGIFLLPLTITILKILNDDGVIHLWKPSKKSDAAAESSTESGLSKPKTKKNTKGRTQNEQNH